MNLSVDGKHSVSVQSDDPAAVTEALLWARKTYHQLTVLPARPFQSASKEEREQITQAVPSVAEETEPPTCTIHDLPMVRVQGKKGAFWSCHQRNPDGSWCSYRPQGL